MNEANTLISIPLKTAKNLKLPAEEQQQLLRFLLRVVPVAGPELPAPREFTDEQIQGWLAEDEASMRHFREYN